MQKYTELKLRELRDSYSLQMSDDWDEAASNMAARGFSSPSGMFFQQIEEIGIKYLDKLLEELFTVEKTALVNELSQQPANYFDTLKTEMTEVASGFLRGIYSRIDSYGSHGPRGMADAFREARERYIQIYSSKVSTKVEIIKEELRLKIVPGGGTVINVGGDSGVINTGTVYGDIHVHIEKMKGTDAKDLAEIFDKFLLAIKDSSERDNDKVALMENVEMLVSQYEAPPEQRKRGWIMASINTLSVAGSLTTLWQQFGPVIKEAFRQYIP